MYQIRIQDSAAHELSQLDRQVARRIVKRIRWLAANAEAVKPDAWAEILRASTSSGLATTALCTSFFAQSR